MSLFQLLNRHYFIDCFVQLTFHHYPYTIVMCVCDPFKCICLLTCILYIPSVSWVSFNVLEILSIGFIHEPLLKTRKSLTVVSSQYGTAQWCTSTTPLAQIEPRTFSLQVYMLLNQVIYSDSHRLSTVRIYVENKHVLQTLLVFEFSFPAVIN